MKVGDIEALPEVRQATTVLSALEKRGLVEPAIASGWTRAMLTDCNRTDIDVAYVGPVHYNDAQKYLREILDELGFDPDPWDINGIWNSQMAYGVKHTVEDYLLNYVCSIDSVYLASDGKLHDPTGFGFKDGEAKLLRINEYDRQDGRIPTAFEETYVCIQGCRRIAQHGWRITPASKKRIIEGVSAWSELTDDQRAEFTQNLGKKIPLSARKEAQLSFAKFGWGFIFDLL